MTNPVEHLHVPHRRVPIAKCARDEQLVQGLNSFAARCRRKEGDRDLVRSVRACELGKSPRRPGRPPRLGQKRRDEDYPGSAVIAGWSEPRSTPRQLGNSGAQPVLMEV
ncbi:MAG: hypothetical protein VW239_01495, partial [Candidatus Nanopelagicales bacterium]